MSDRRNDSWRRWFELQRGRHALFAIVIAFVSLWFLTWVPLAMAQTVPPAGEEFGAAPFDGQLFDAGGEASEAGELPELETDRDAFTPATSTAGVNLSIVESSYTFIDNRNVAETHSYPELLVRHGITGAIELRIGWNYEVGGTGDLVSGDEVGGEVAGDELERESQILYGFKVAVSEQDGWTPRSAAIVQGYTPTSGETSDTDLVAAYTFGWELANQWRLDSAIRYGTEHVPEDAFNQWAPSIVLRIPLDEQWHAHIEYFGIFTDGAEPEESSREFISPGVHCLITPNLELGARAGWGINDESPRFFSNVGIGWRF